MKYVFSACLLLLFCSLAGQNWRDSLLGFESDTAALSYLDKRIGELKYADPHSTEELVILYDSVASQTSDLRYLITAKLNYADRYYTLEDYDEALPRYIDILETLEDTEEYDLLARTYNNLGSCYQVRNDTKTSTEYFEKALVIYREIRDTFWIANVNSNLGLQFLNDGFLEKAEPHFNEAVEIYDLIGNTIFKGITLLNRGNLRIEQEAYYDAVSDYRLSRSLIPEQVSPIINAALKAGEGTAYNRLKKYNAALPLLLKSLEEAKSINHAGQMRESSRELADLYKSTGNYKESLVHFEAYTEIKDSMFTLEQDGKLADALARYESEKKEAEIVLLNSKNEIQKTKLEARNKQLLIVGFSAIVLLGLLFLAGFLYKKNRKQKDIISEALEDKDTLLKEIHHRVKNNLQVISALLTLQSKHVKDDQAVLALQEGQGRVQSMALIHQDLYQHDNLKGVNTKQYFEKLIKNLVQTYDSDDKEIEVAFDIASIILDVDSMIPLGLVVNELTSNALKHGLKNKQSGKILIELSEEADELHLKIKDNGEGANLDDIQNTSFGYSLIRSFARRLDADLNIKNEEGLSVTMRIRNFKKVA